MLKNHLWIIEVNILFKVRLLWRPAFEPQGGAQRGSSLFKGKQEFHMAARSASLNLLLAHLSLPIISCSN